MPAARPATVEELGELVRRAAADKSALYPVGGGTFLGLGTPPSRPGTAVDTTALAEVIDYPARDMTVTVRAGVTLAALAKVLRGERQRLPVDVPRPATATLGGAIAANVSGPRRLGFGTLRDYVIGISVVGDTGAEAKAGGRVVKNVAGYDLCKLHTGALGTLGVISQVTLKLKPLPEASAVVAFACESGDLPALVDALHHTRSRPVAAEALNRAAAAEAARSAGVRLPSRPWVLLAGFEEKGETVAWQVRQLQDELARTAAKDVHVFRDGADADLWPALSDLRLCDAAVTVKFNAVPSAAAALALAADAAPGARVQAHAVTGVVYAHLPADGLTADALAAMLKGWDAPLGADGNRVLERCPSGWKATLPVWGRPRGDRSLMAAVKRQLDPGDVFNAGRFA